MRFHEFCPCLNHNFLFLNVQFVFAVEEIETVKIDTELQTRFEIRCPWTCSSALALWFVLLDDKLDLKSDIQLTLFEHAFHAFNMALQANFELDILMQFD